LDEAQPKEFATLLLHPHSDEGKAIISQEVTVNLKEDTRLKSDYKWKQ